MVPLHYCLRPNTKARKKWVSIAVLGILAIVFGWLYFSFSWRFGYTDALGERHAKGTVEREAWKTASDPKYAHLLPDEPVDATLPEKDQIRLYWGSDPSQRWTDESIHDNEWWMVVYWYPTVFGWTGLASIYVATKANARKPKGHNR